MEEQKNVLSLMHRGEHRLNMDLDLQSLFELLCTAVLIDRDPATPPPPAFGLIVRGRC